MTRTAEQPLCPNDLREGEIYNLTGVGLCQYQGIAEYCGQSTFKFWSDEFRQHQFELNTKRVFLPPVVTGREKAGRKPTRRETLDWLKEQLIKTTCFHTPGYYWHMTAIRDNSFSEDA